jgi:hypothetical protein
MNVITQKIAKAIMKLRFLSDITSVSRRAAHSVNGCQQAITRFDRWSMSDMAIFNGGMCLRRTTQHENRAASRSLIFRAQTRHFMAFDLNSAHSSLRNRG